jgi:hypothetical protein
MQVAGTVSWKAREGNEKKNLTPAVVADRPGFQPRRVRVFIDDNSIVIVVPVIG